MSFYKKNLALNFKVWTCNLNDALLCTGGEDASLKVWDVRTQSMVQRVTEFSAGVTFSKWQEENIILTGSYDQHVRVFDIRKSKEPLKDRETSGGVWYVEQFQHADKQHYIAACMYGGWAILNENLEFIKTDEKAGKELLYGVTMASENLLVYTTFNDYKVTSVTV
ncbi:WD domain, G-beta repeat protein [Oesophagostomum dentatum]|uniref:methylated diphthine methylhydrolase n=1 Tax=Oesophagostomum dentatum TaxID=61180 RepID=A0A0B1SJQ1_OESDE|nr:WD domain, G-beta repeat protein [Oesophagostomum dentatum]